MTKKIFIMLMAVIALMSAAQAQSPAEVLSKSVAKINNAAYIDCKFSLSGSNGSLNGSISAQGRKFRLTTPAGSTWYDGTNMWTANTKSKEITLVNPTENEVNESNPFAYLSSYKSQYNLFFSKRKESGRYLVLLNPKKKNADIKAVEVAVNKKTFLPERFIIRDRNDNVTTVTVQSLSLKNSGAASFSCPVQNMSDYELIDLR